MAASLASMPETPIEKDGDSLVRKDDIRISKDAAGSESPARNATSSQHRCDSAFSRTIVMGANSLHDLGTLLL
jgi:hypothetical protein